MKEKTFAIICYNILMSTELHHPNYMEEKTSMLNAGFDAYSYLDIKNQQKLINYFNYWKLELPEKIKQYEENKY